MAERDWRAELGEADLGIAGFQLWIHGREYPEAQDYQDGNWLRVTVHCGALGASVWAEGAIVQAQDIEFFAQGCEKMSRGEAAEASLAPVEPYFDVELEATDARGHILLRVRITPDNLTQSHSFEFEINQSYLPGVIAQCADALVRFPVRGGSGY